MTPWYVLHCVCIACCFVKVKLWVLYSKNSKPIKLPRKYFYKWSWIIQRKQQQNYFDAKLLTRIHGWSSTSEIDGRWCGLGDNIFSTKSLAVDEICFHSAVSNWCMKFSHKDNISFTLFLWKYLRQHVPLQSILVNVVQSRGKVDDQKVGHEAWLPHPKHHTVYRTVVLKPPQVPYIADNRLVLHDGNKQKCAQKIIIKKIGVENPLRC